MGDVACINFPGTYTVSITQTATTSGGAGVAELHVGGTSGTQTLAVIGNSLGNASLYAGSGGTVGPHGRLNLDSTDPAKDASLCSGSGLTIEGGGTLDISAGAGGTRTLKGSLINQGTMNVGADAVAPSLHTCGFNPISNSGTVNISAGKTLTASEGYSQTAGTTAVGTGGLTAGSAVSVSGGTFTGNAPVLNAPNTFMPTGGSGTFKVHGSGLLGSNVGSGITIVVEGTAAGDAQLQVMSPVTNAGTVRLTSSDATKTARFGVGPVDNTVLTNTGTIETQTGTAGVSRTVFGPISNSGTLTINGDTDGSFGNTALQLTNSGAITVASGKTFTLPAAFTQSGGTLTVAGTLSKASQTIPIAGGVVNGVGTIIANLNNSGGTVAPGTSPGILTIIGDYTQGSSGTLAVDVAGPSAGTGYDRLNVSGNVALAGALRIITGVGFTPPPGQTFYQIVTAGGLRSGTFAPVTGTDPSSGLSFAVQYNPSNVTLRAQFSPPPAPPPQAVGPTGQRAAALKKCKKMHSHKKRKKCRQRANLLPV